MPAKMTIQNWVPRRNISAGYPRIVTEDWNEASSDMATGNSDRDLLPVWNSRLSSFFFRSCDHRVTIRLRDEERKN